MCDRPQTRIPIIVVAVALLLHQNDRESAKQSAKGTDQGQQREERRWICRNLPRQGSQDQIGRRRLRLRLRQRRRRRWTGVCNNKHKLLASSHGDDPGTNRCQQRAEGRSIHNQQQVCNQSRNQSFKSKNPEHRSPVAVPSCTTTTTQSLIHDNNTTGKKREKLGIQVDDKRNRRATQCIKRVFEKNKIKSTNNSIVPFSCPLTINALCFTYLVVLSQTVHCKGQDRTRT